MKTFVTLAPGSYFFLKKQLEQLLSATLHTPVPLIIFRKTPIGYMMEHQTKAERCLFSEIAENCCFLEGEGFLERSLTEEDIHPCVYQLINGCTACFLSDGVHQQVPSPEATVFFLGIEMPGSSFKVNPDDEVIEIMRDDCI